MPMRGGRAMWMPAPMRRSETTVGSCRCTLLEWERRKSLSIELYFMRCAGCNTILRRPFSPRFQPAISEGSTGKPEELLPGR